MTSNNRCLSIGEMAEKAGIKTSRIRYYEEIGLMPEPVRTQGDQRIYTSADLKRAVFIRRCRDFGFSLKQVRELVDLSVCTNRDCAEVGTLAREHLDVIKSRIAELRDLEKALEGFVGICDDVCSGGACRDCLVFEGISVT